MNSAMKDTWDLLRLLRRGGPALCNIAVTNSSNATRDFCNFANGKIARKDLRWIDASRLNAALESSLLPKPVADMYPATSLR